MYLKKKSLLYYQVAQTFKLNFAACVDPVLFLQVIKICLKEEKILTRNTDFLLEPKGQKYSWSSQWTRIRTRKLRDPGSSSLSLSVFQRECWQVTLVLLRGRTRLFAVARSSPRGARVHSLNNISIVQISGIHQANQQ